MSERIIREVADREQWTDETLLGVLIDYISNQQSDDALLDYLNGRSEQPDLCVGVGEQYEVSDVLKRMRERYKHTNNFWDAIADVLRGDDDLITKEELEQAAQSPDAPKHKERQKEAAKYRDQYQITIVFTRSLEHDLECIRDGYPDKDLPEALAGLIVGEIQEMQKEYGVPAGECDVTKVDLKNNWDSV
jgi:hypothetical protein